MKFRPDAHKPGFMIDLKTATDGSCYLKHSRHDIEMELNADGTYEITPQNEWMFGGFPESIRKYKYDWQAYHYTRGMYEVTGKHHNLFWIVVEKSEPHAVNCYKCADWRIDKAESEVIPLLRRMKIFLNKKINIMEV